jgi:hypothetical protein
MRKVGHESYVRGMGKSYTIFVREATWKDHLEDKYNKDNIKVILEKKV